MCVGYSADDMSRIRGEIDDKIRQEARCDDLFFGALDIRAAVKRLKPHKNDTYACLSSDHFINADDDCFTICQYRGELAASWASV